jgi:hypothetical protein
LKLDLQKVILLILFSLFCKVVVCQVDSGTSALSADDNYFSPGHNRISDSLHQTVSGFGIYASAGIGIRTGSIATANFSASFARKCFLFSISESILNSFSFIGSGKEDILKMDNTSFLFGISKRRKYSLASISAGLAFTNYFFEEGTDNSSSGPPLRFNYKNKLSIPIEVKLFLLARNGIGLGLVVSKNFGVNLAAPLSLNFSIVTGEWNRRRYFIFPKSPQLWNSKPAKENHYLFLEHKLQDSSKMTVSRFGNYFSICYGPLWNKKYPGYGTLFSYSLAYKSHIITVSKTREEAGVYGNGYFSDLRSLLIGESFRGEHLMISLSAGMGKSKIWTYKGIYPNTITEIHYELNFPFEFKFFLHAYNVAGLGLVASATPASKYKQGSFFIGAAIVLGKWNK